MSAVFHVLEGGLQTTIQDEGRHGLLAIGVPASGALDKVSYRLGNLIVNNPLGSAALELRSPGPVLRIDADFARVALTGTSASLIVERAGTRHEWSPWRAVDLRRGDILRVAPFADTAIAYLAVAGGLDVPVIFRSRSTFLRGGFGGVDGRALSVGNDLPLADTNPREQPCFTLLRPPLFAASPILRALPGRQAGHFSPQAVAAFYGEEFRVSRDLDRMGMRLEGPTLRAASHDIASDATVPGAVQVPSSGQAILLLNDCQTTGGYPKMAVVITADLGAAGRCLPGAVITFQKVTMSEAEKARLESDHDFQRLATGLVPVRDASPV